MESVERCENSDRFELTRKNLQERVRFAAVTSRKCWAIHAGRDTVPKCGIIKTNKWKIDVGFDEWTKRQKSNCQIPLVQWMTIKQDKKTKKSIVRANRKFVAGEVIGLFCGDRLRDDETPSEFAFENKYGIYDARRGFVGDGAPVYSMAVHIMRVSFDEKEFNARLSHDFLVRAVRDIEVKEIFFLTYDNETVWKPKIVSTKKTKKYEI
jgi:hypothetical protein